MLAPLQPGPLLEVDEDLRSRQRLRAIWSGLAPSLTVTLLGLPSVLVPTGLHGGLPTGVQLIAGRHREARCLAAGAAVECDVSTPVQALWVREARRA